MAVEHVIVMGVSGSGKSTLGAVLAARLGRPFLEGDAFHPPANVAKMTAGVPLPDELARRMSTRTGHFMPPELLASQLATLEPPADDEDGLTVAATGGVEALADEVVDRLGPP